MKYRAVYDSQGKAYEFKDNELVWMRDDLKERQNQPTNSAPRVMADIPDFVSPLDGSVVKGRAGLRDHCARHNVVPTADLAGLPLKTMNQQYKPDAAYREATKRTIAEIINSRTY